MQEVRAAFFWHRGRTGRGYEMTTASVRSLSDALLERYQRDFPLVAEPFAQIAGALDTTEASVLCALRDLVSNGIVGRIGGVARPNTLGASTLAAMAAPELRTETVAELLASEPGINHVYLRENAWNLWFVATGPDRGYVDRLLRRVEDISGLRALDLRLEQAFYIDLGFPLDASDQTHVRPYRDALRQDFVPEPTDRNLVQAMTQGIPLESRPFLEVARRLRTSEQHVISRLGMLLEAGLITRIGAIVRHRALGWRSNAMVVWDVDPDAIEAKGRALACQPGINLCYRRTRYETAWPYNLYCMIHAKSRAQAHDLLHRATRAAGLDSCPSQILFSSRCYKQTGALISSPKEAA